MAGRGTGSRLASKYNGSIQYFLADIAPSFPCHPLYEEEMTWFNMATDENNWISMSRVLDSLAEAGFNGVRLPMFPESDKVTGQDPQNFLANHKVGWVECNQYALNVANRIYTAKQGEDKFYGFQIYYSPAFENKRFQEELDVLAYSDWVTKFMKTEYHAHFLSPFRSNSSFLAKEPILGNSGMQDATTLWEIELLTLLRRTDAYIQAVYKPRIIGPDRGTVEHTVNTLESYGSSLKTDISSVRPEYRKLVDIVGTGATYPDSSARKENLTKLTNESLQGVWCTLCSQEWDRVSNMPLQAVKSDELVIPIDEDVRLLLMQAPKLADGSKQSYWGNYENTRGIPQPPASQVLDAKFQGFVAEAAIPRFVMRNGNLVDGRNWALNDMMVDRDSDRLQYVAGLETQKQQSNEPQAGERSSPSDPAMQPMCLSAGNGLARDFVLPGYESCSLEFTSKQFENATYEDADGSKLILLYVNHPSGIRSWIETCKIEDAICETTILQQGNNFQVKNDPRFQVRFLFENWTATDTVFQLDYEGQISTIIGESAFYSLAPIAASLLTLLITAF